MPVIKGHTYNASLAGFYLANFLVFIAVAFGDGSLPDNWNEVTAQWKSMIPVGVGVVLVGILNSLLSPAGKARLVFLRFRNALPGHRAFTKLGPADPRVDMEKLKAKLGGLPSDPAEQNKVWYRLYQTVEDQPLVLAIHRDFLLARDFAAGAMVMAVLFPISCVWFADHWQPAAIYAFVMLLQAALIVRAAWDRGNRFVTTVLARATLP